MKKGLIMFLALFIAGTISLTACQRKEPAAPAEAPATQEQAPKAPADEAAPTGENAPAAPAEQPAGGK
ncbi:MAG: hypothetical protein HZB32_03545 [Nitrospirae bacterium]|nr:hypothetical protein [Nitrospirota bacterium]